MNSFACLQSSRRALHRVFIEHETLLTRQFLPAQRTLPIYQNRLFSASPLQLKGRRQNSRKEEPETDDLDSEDRPERFVVDRRYTTQKAFEQSGRDRLPQDFEITDPKIMVLDNGVFDGPFVTRNVLSRLPDTESLRMITPYIIGDPKANKPNQYAICKIVNKRDEYERQRELKQRQRLSKMATPKQKEIEMSWAISDNDFQMKTNQLIDFLSKGDKVEIVLGFKKKGQKKRTSEETAEEVWAKVRKLVEDLGSREYKPSEGEVGRTMRVYVQGISKQETKRAANEKAPAEKAPAEKAPQEADAKEV
ncbi:translation initiation factor if-3 [Fusarium austroafricanum]|uniref:Translation initiation factor if-3 n=1 Tax=Fusarium austroafricanum TaxID=2364996 RepID=A0A8H4KKI7_9HYPO|nr:translation initiation factor if-3 [Fusarium austroafricanum]